jgi:hypothetical protein
MVSTEAPPQTAIRPLSTRVCLDGLLVAQDTVAVTGGPEGGAFYGAPVASWAPTC